MTRWMSLTRSTWIGSATIGRGSMGYLVTLGFVLAAIVTLVMTKGR